MKKYDAIIIGFGKGGKTLAGFLANKGQHVAVIEKSDKMYGGTCINVGCIPSKSLVNSAEKIENKSFSTFEEKERYYRDSIQKKEKLIAALRGKNYEMLASRETITIYDGKFIPIRSKNVVKIGYNGKNSYVVTLGYDENNEKVMKIHTYKDDDNKLVEFIDEEMVNSFFSKMFFY